MNTRNRGEREGGGKREREIQRKKEEVREQEKMHKATHGRKIDLAAVDPELVVIRPESDVRSPNQLIQLALPSPLSQLITGLCETGAYTYLSLSSL